jgi:hypothetical protein
MYKGKRPLPHRLAKALDKEIDKAGKAEVHTSLDAPLPPPRRLQPPKKVSQADRRRVMEMIREEEKAGKHGFKKVSKRTTAATVDAKSPPAHIHPEGKRWIKNLVKQNRAQNKIDNKKFAKNR